MVHLLQVISDASIYISNARYGHLGHREVNLGLKAYFKALLIISNSIKLIKKYQSNRLHTLTSC